MVSEVFLFSQCVIPGGHPIGNNCFFYSDLRTFRALFLNLYYSINLHPNPPYPLKQKREQIERVLKGKLFINTVQQSNSPTAKNILKCNSLLYSSIYILFNYIYILQSGCFVGHCWTCWIELFQPSNIHRPTKTAKKNICWTCWTPSNSIFLIVNFANSIIISNFIYESPPLLDGWTVGSKNNKNYFKNIS